MTSQTAVGDVQKLGNDGYWEKSLCRRNSNNHRVDCWSPTDSDLAEPNGSQRKLADILEEMEGWKPVDSGLASRTPHGSHSEAAEVGVSVFRRKLLALYDVPLMRSRQVVLFHLFLQRDLHVHIQFFRRKTSPLPLTSMIRSRFHSDLARASYDVRSLVTAAS